LRPFHGLRANGPSDAAKCDKTGKIASSPFDTYSEVKVLALVVKLRETPFLRLGT
jgi:hypothetical protein